MKTRTFSAIATIFLLAAPARANDPATAQTLFDQGRKLMAEERYAEACPKLEESQRLDPAGGTLLHLALCREHEGRIATAWAIYQDALAQAKRDARRDRAKIAQDRIDALGPKLPKMRVRVAAQNRKLSGFEIARDGLPVGEAQWGDAYPVDPGTRTLTARAHGRRPWSTKVAVPARPEEIVVEIPELELEPQEPVVTAPTPNRLVEANQGEAQRTVAIALGGVGVVSLVVGSVFGIVSLSKKSEADAECAPPDRRLCSTRGVEAGDEQIAAGNVSTVGFIAGGVLVAAGVTLYLTAPRGAASSSGQGGRSVSITPTAWQGGGGLGLTGRF
ncbi:MAG: hypothetical protein KF819_08980 [Labilithrix sp.]|nr:hypothetical protein [Labilithrix sp.]